MPEQTETGNDILCTVEEVLAFAKLTLDNVKLVDVNQARAMAADLCFFISPRENKSRSERAEGLRKHSQLLLATSEIYSRIAQFLAITLPQKTLVGTPFLQSGTDYPTPTDYQSTFQRAAEEYRNRGMSILKMIASVGASISA